MNPANLRALFHGNEGETRVRLAAEGLVTSRPPAASKPVLEDEELPDLTDEELEEQALHQDDEEEQELDEDDQAFADDMQDIVDSWGFGS